MRTCEKKRKHLDYVLDENGELHKSNLFDNTPPSEIFLQSLEHPSRVSRSKSFVKKGILKLNSWKSNYKNWLEKGFLPGDTIQKAGLLREFSLSQFTYRTVEQFLAIDKEVQRNKRRFNQSYEGYFTNLDGTLDYQAMITEIDEIIARGCLSINKELDKSRNRSRKCDMSHPDSEVYETIKNGVNRSEMAYSDDEVIDFDWDDDIDIDELIRITGAEMDF